MRRWLISQRWANGCIIADQLDKSGRSRGLSIFGQRVKAGQMESCQPVAFDGFLDNANQLLNMLEMRDNIGKIPDKDIVLPSIDVMVFVDISI